MKKILLFLVIVFSINLLSFSQDKILKSNGDVIDCKITGEDSSKVYFKLKIKGIYVDTYLSKKDIASFEKKSEKTWSGFEKTEAMLKLDFLFPSAELEVRISPNNTFLLGYHPGIASVKWNDEPTETCIVNHFKMGIRMYYDVYKRNQKGKKTYKLSANYIGTSFIAGMESKLTDKFFTFGPVWGIQRSFGKIGHFSFELGVGLTKTNGYYSSNFTLTPMGKVSLGVAL